MKNESRGRKEREKRKRERGGGGGGGETMVEAMTEQLCNANMALTMINLFPDWC